MLYADPLRYSGWRGICSGFSEMWIGGLSPCLVHHRTSHQISLERTRVQGLAGSLPQLGSRPRGCLGRGGHAAPVAVPGTCVIRTSLECAFLGEFHRRARAAVPTDAGQHVQPFQIALAHGGFTRCPGIWLCNSTPDTAGHPPNSVTF